MLGSLNPLPFRVGGGPTNASKAYGLIRRAVGTGGSAPNDLGIDGLWRRSRAKGLAAASSHVRRALLQAWPNLATDLIPGYEGILRITPPPGQTLEERRRAVVRKYTATPSMVIRDLVAELQTIDTRFTCPEHDPATDIATLPGRAFGPLSGAVETPAYGGIGSSLVPAYSTSHILYLRLTPGYSGALRLSDEALLAEAKRLIRRRLPSWYEFEITYTTPGFVLGTSKLGYTGLTL